MREGQFSTNGDPVRDHEKKRLGPNAVFAVLQVLVSSVILFLLYRFLLVQLGVEALGVWSLVIAATSLANVSNLGLAGGTVRFVSKYLALGDARSAGLAVETSTLSIAAAMGLVVLLLWLVIEWLLALVIPDEWLGQARQIVPFTLAALWLNSVGGAIHSGLDGCHRGDLRSIAVMLTQPVLLLSAIWLVPKLGLKGIAFAQIFQYLVWLALGWVLLRKQLPTLSIIPFRWSRRLFLDMWRYGVSFQLISIFVLLTEPLAKGLLSHYGNLTAVGYFEMANRLVVQVRAILVSANQVLVPYYSKVGEISREKIKAVYLINLNTIFLMGSILFSTLVAMLPLISEMWIGRLEPQFLIFAVMLATGWFLTTLGVPAYFANLGLGRLSHNLLNHATTMFSMVPLAIIGSLLAGPEGGAAAWPISMSIGTFVIVKKFHQAEKISTLDFLCRSNIIVLLLNFFIALFGFIAYYILYNLNGFYIAISSTIVIILGGWSLLLVISTKTREMFSSILAFIFAKKQI